jgi:hypothetical protein
VTPEILEAQHALGDAARVTVTSGMRVRVIGGVHRGRVGEVVAAPSPDGTVYLRARVSPTRRAVIAVRVDQVEPLDHAGPG